MSRCDSPPRFRIVRVGSEPIVNWTEENGRHRFVLWLRGWKFRLGPQRGEFGEGDKTGLIAGTVLTVDDEFVYASEPIPDIEHGWIRICGYSIAELRSIALRRQERRWWGKWRR